MHSLPILKIYLFMSKKSCNLESYFGTDIYNDITKSELPKWQMHGFGIEFVVIFLINYIGRSLDLW